MDLSAYQPVTRATDQRAYLIHLHRHPLVGTLRRAPQAKSYTSTAKWPPAPRMHRMAIT